MSIETLAKQGREQVHTGLAGIDAAKLKTLRNASLKACFNHFDELQYRLEFVARIHDTEFINDAASRNPNATWYSLDRTEGPIVWIANGTDSTVSYKNSVELARQKVKMLICVGQNSQNLHKAFDGVVPNIIEVSNICEAVHKAFYSDIEVKKVLFSPSVESSSSMNQQGEAFTREVNEL